MIILFQRVDLNIGLIYLDVLLCHMFNGVQGGVFCIIAVKRYVFGSCFSTLAAILVSDFCKKTNQKEGVLKGTRTVEASRAPSIRMK